MRRIWNTMPTCTARAVATTISKTIPAKLDMQVKRKTKRLANKTIWWFFLHGNEGDLSLLDRDWEKVQHQTLWSLQNCYMSSDGCDIQHPPADVQTHSRSPIPSRSPQIHTGASPAHAHPPNTDQCEKSVVSENHCALPPSPSKQTLESPKMPLNSSQLKLLF